MTGWTRREFVGVVGAAGVFGTFAGTDGTAGKDEGESWIQFGYDPGNSGYASANTGPAGTRVERQWQFDTGGSTYFPPAVASGRLYVGSQDENLHAVDTATGESVWSHGLDDIVYSPTAVVDGTVYVGSAGETLHAVDAETGDGQWTFDTGSVPGISFAVDGGNVYLGTGEGAVYALDAADGRQSWQHGRGARIRGLAADDGTVYVGDDDGDLYAVEVGSDQRSWTFGIGGRIQSVPAVVGDTVYVGNDNHRLYAVTRNGGDQRWQFDAGGPVYSSPAVADGRVVVTSRSGAIHAVSAADGSEQWRVGTGVTVDSSPAVVDGTVYVGTGDGHVYALSLEDGSELWRVRTGGAVDASPVVLNGTVYAVTATGRIHAIGEADTPTSSPTETVGSSASLPGGEWPTVQYTPANTGYAPEEGGPQEAIAENWRLQTDGSVRASPVVRDGTVYAGSEDGTVYAVDAQTGRREWTFPTGGRIDASPTVAGETVFVGSMDGTVYALAAESGERQWEYDANGGIFSDGTTVVDGTLFFGTGLGDGEVHAVSTADGTRQWSFGSSGDIASTPAVDGGRVFANFRGSSLVALDAETGAVDWNSRSAYDYCSPTVADGSVYVGASDGVSALDPDSGERQWGWTSGQGDAGNAVTVGDGTVYATMHSGTIESTGAVYALDPETREVRWQSDVGGHRSDPVLADGVLYFGTLDGYVYALDAATGTERWRFETGNRIYASPAVVGGSVYVGSDDGNLYALTEPDDVWTPTRTQSRTSTPTPSSTSTRMQSRTSTRMQSRTSTPTGSPGVGALTDAALSDSRVLAGGLATLLAAGSAAWWRYGGGAGGPTPSDGPPDASDSGATASGTSSPGSGGREDGGASGGESATQRRDDLLAEAKETLVRGDNLRDEGSRAYARREYDAARETAEAALELAREHGLDESEASARVSAAERRIRETYRVLLAEDLEDIESRLYRAKRTLEADPDEAKAAFERIAADLDDHAETARAHDLAESLERVESLRERCAEGLAAVDREETNARLDELEADLADLSASVDSGRPAALRERVADVEDALARVESEAERLDEGPRSRVADLREAVERERARIDAAATLREELGAIRQRVDAADAESDPEGALDSLDEVEEALADLESAATEHDLAGLESDVRALEERCETVRSAASERLERDAARDALAADVSAVRDRLDDAEVALEAGELDEATEGFEGVRERLAELDQRASDREFASLQAEVAALRERCEEGIQSATGRRRERVVDALQSRASELDERLDAVADDVDAAGETAAGADPGARLDGVLADVDGASGGGVRARLADAAGDVDRLAAEAADLGTDAGDDPLEGSVDRLRTRVDRLDARIEAVTELATDLDSCRERLERAERALEANRPETAFERFASLETDLDGLADDVASHGTDALEAAFEDLVGRVDAGLVATSDAVAPGPPEEVPGVPSATVDYTALDRGDLVGKGGNADVYLVTVTVDGDPVDLALKEPRVSGTLHSETVDRFTTEAETWSKLDDHDHIVGVVDWGTHSLPWIAMEYMDGGDLAARAGDLPPDQALWTAVAVTNAVWHAHRRGVAHLDLKPENVLFREVDGAWDVPKVTDWGLSKHLLEHSKSVEGISPHYAAPEQFDDAYGPADDITDVYQLGAVFYELFTGRPPFEGQPAAVMHEVLHGEPDPPTEHADLPAELDEILLTALASRKEDRYEDVLYLRDALRGLRDRL